MLTPAFKALTLFIAIFVCVPQLQADTEDPPLDVLVVGGGKINEYAKKYFLRKAGPEKPILVFRWASKKYTVREKGDFEDQLGELGGKDVETVKLFEKIKGSEELQNELIAQIQAAGGLFFLGGAQDYLVMLLKEVPRVFAAIRQHALSGKIIGGTSAGAAFLSDTMLYENEEDPDLHLEPGAKIVRPTVDTHYLKRKRGERALAALEKLKKKNPNAMALGVDEGTAVLIKDNLVRVVGAGYAQVLWREDGSTRDRDLHGGDSFDFKTHQYEKGHDHDFAEVAADDHTETTSIGN